MSEPEIIGSASRPGPEADLVAEFVASFQVSRSKDLSRTVLLEPGVAGSQPDIVIVDWDPEVASGWPDRRENLTTADLQLIHLTYLHERPDLALLAELFPRGLDSSIRRLSEAGLIEVDRGVVRTRPVEEVFFVRRILAFEAKISSISRAIQQAFRNTWFCSESYVLTRVRNPRERTVHQIEAAGLGLWLITEEAAGFPLIRAAYRSLPQSYGSWHINETVWRHHFLN